MVAGKLERLWCVCVLERGRRASAERKAAEEQEARRALKAEGRRACGGRAQALLRRCRRG